MLSFYFLISTIHTDTIKSNFSQLLPNKDIATQPNLVTTVLFHGLMIKHSCWKGQALFFIIMAFRSEQWAECTNTKLALTDCYLCDRLGAASHPTCMTFHKPENYKTPLFFYNMQPCMQQLSFLLCVSTAVPGIVNMAIKQICCHLPLCGSEVVEKFLPAWQKTFNRSDVVRRTGFLLRGSYSVFQHNQLWTGLKVGMKGKMRKSFLP